MEEVRSNIYAKTKTKQKPFIIMGQNGNKADRKETRNLYYVLNME